MRVAQKRTKAKTGPRSVPKQAGVRKPRTQRARSTPKSRRDRWIRRWLVGPVVAASVVAIGIGATASPLFDAKTIVVRGQSHLSRGEVLRLAAIDHGTNVFWLPSGRAERLLEADPWISSAAIDRTFPSTVRISIAERRAASEVRVGSRWLLVAADGTVLDWARRDPGLPALPASSSLTLGRKSATLAASARIAAEMSPWLRSRVASILPEPGDEVVLELATGTRAVLGPPTDVAAKERALEGVLRWAKDHHRVLEYVDVRAPLAPAARAVKPAGA
jgi:cell division protein FtsQ